MNLNIIFDAVVNFWNRLGNYNICTFNEYSITYRGFLSCTIVVSILCLVLVPWWEDDEDD